MESTTPRNRFVALFMMLALVFSVIGPVTQPAAGQEPPPPNYCDASLIGQGSVYDSLSAARAALVDPDLLDCLDIPPYAPSACYLNVELVNRSNFYYTTTWWEEDAAGNKLPGQPMYGNAFPAVFEDRGPGTQALVRVFIGGPERDYNPFALAEGPYFWPYDIGTDSGGGGVVVPVSTDCPVSEEVQWCSPGYWKNNTANWPVDPNTLFVDVFGYEPQGKKAPATGATLLYVLQNPKIYGGDLTELVADYLSDEHTDIYYTGDRYNQAADGTWYHVCPLPGN